MDIPFLYQQPTWALVLVLFLSMILATTMGHFLGKRLYKESEKDDIVLAALFTLFGLLLSFTFSMSVTRHDKRIGMIIQEANCIGTAVLRADLYPAELRKQFREDFKNYTLERIAYFNSVAYSDEESAALKKANDLSRKIWNRAIQSSSQQGLYLASMQMVPALNQMIDIASARGYVNNEKVPDTVLYLLYIFGCTCSFFAGFISSGKGKMIWLYRLGFCLLTCTVCYIIFDMDRSRTGLITLKRTNQAVVDVLKMFE